jgi:hypothetical protein
LLYVYVIKRIINKNYLCLEIISFLQTESVLKFIATKEYDENPIWKLTNTSVSFINISSRWLGGDPLESNSDLFFNITLKRQPNYYMINFVFPCFILNLITLFLFFMPFSLQAVMSKYILQFIYINLKECFKKNVFL